MWNYLTSLTPAAATVITGLVALSGSIVVWALGNYATKRREAQNRAAEVRKQFLEKQIAEFYGPLLSLLSRVDAIQDIRKRLIEAFQKKGGAYQESCVRGHKPAQLGSGGTHDHPQRID